MSASKKRRDGVKIAARFDPVRGSIADYTLMARRPTAKFQDADHKDASKSFSSSFVHRQVTLTVPMLAGGDQYAPPQFVESRIELGEDGARELIDQLRAALDWLREPYEEDEVTE